MWPFSSERGHDHDQQEDKDIKDKDKDKEKDLKEMKDMKDKDKDIGSDLVFWMFGSMGNWVGVWCKDHPWIGVGDGHR